MKRKRTAYTLTLEAPADLRDAVKRVAVVTDRSVSATVRVLLWEAIRARERPVEVVIEGAVAKVP